MRKSSVALGLIKEAGAGKLLKKLIKNTGREAKGVAAAAAIAAPFAAAGLIYGGPKKKMLSDPKYKV